jgi:hypothetical protein
MEAVLGGVAHNVWDGSKGTPIPVEFILHRRRDMVTNTVDAQEHTAKGAHETGEDWVQSTTSARDSDYDAKDCYGDCMRLFRYEDREEPECARACGFDAP